MSTIARNGLCHYNYNGLVSCHYSVETQAASRLIYPHSRPQVLVAIDLLSVRMETGVGEALAFVLAEESAVAQHNVVDFIS